MSTEPAGRTAIVTGAGTGIGKAIALRLVKSGVRVALLGRRPEPLERTAATIAASDGESVPIPTDLCDARQVQAALKLARSALGPIEILINNAGAAHSAPLAKVSDADWDRLLDLNLRAPFRLAAHCLPDMQAAGYGRIVNIASVAAHRGWPYTSLYTTSKHALGGLTRSLAASFVGTGITANAICPGYVETAIVENAAKTISDKTGSTESEAKDRLAAMNPLQRLVTPEEVAESVAYCLGANSGAISGHSLILDGGTQPV